jgi:trk system potassium uptake protein TrkA
MKTIVVGGGKVGFYLIKTLLSKKLDVILIEKNASSAYRISNELNIEVVHGDGTDLRVLKEAGIENCDVIAAVTGNDEENLVICQIAKVQYKVAKTLARVNNPKNITMFRQLGVDKAICSTKVIADLIEYEVETDYLRIIQTFDLGDMVLAEIMMFPACSWADKQIKTMPIPHDCVIVSIARDGNLIYPRGDTTILPADKVLIVIDKKNIPELRKILTK